MRNAGVFSKMLATFGTVLVLFPFVFMLITAAGSLFSPKPFQMDFLLPAELFWVDIPGALLLLWAALRTHTLRAWTCTSVIAAIAFFLGTTAYAIFSGLAAGNVEEKGLILIIAISLTVAFALALLSAGLAGIFLTIRLFQYKPPVGAA